MQTPGGAIQNHATQNADGKSQSYGAMVVHVQGNVALEDAIKNVATTQQTAGPQEETVYRNTNGDADLEKTQWFGATYGRVAGDTPAAAPVRVKNASLGITLIAQTLFSKTRAYYEINDFLGTFHERHGHYLRTSANEDVWRIAAGKCCCIPRSGDGRRRSMSLK